MALLPPTASSLHVLCDLGRLDWRQRLILGQLFPHLLAFRASWGCLIRRKPLACAPSKAYADHECSVHERSTRRSDRRRTSYPAGAAHLKYRISEKRHRILVATFHRISAVQPTTNRRPTAVSSVAFAASSETAQVWSPTTPSAFTPPQV